MIKPDSQLDDIDWKKKIMIMPGLLLVCTKRQVAINPNSFQLYGWLGCICVHHISRAMTYPLLLSL